MQDYFHSIPLFNDWTKGKFTKFTLCLKFKEFNTIGQLVVKEGAHADYVYLVKHGEFTIVKENLKTIDRSMIDYLYPDDKAE